MSLVGYFGIQQSAFNGSKENTGNFLHGYAARQIIGDGIELGPQHYREDKIKALREKISHVVYVAATTIEVNRVSKYAKNFRAHADFIERLGLPVVVLGMGAQAILGSTVKGSWVDDDTKQLLRVLSAHSETMAVRGAYTADLIYAAGVKNIEVVGCQSTFLSRDPNFQFPEMPADIAAIPSDRIAVNITRVDLERNLIKEAMAGNATHIGQSAHLEYLIKDLPEGVAVADLPEEAAKLVAPPYVRLFRDGGVTFADYHKWVRAHFQQFYSMPEWFNYMRGRFDVAIGTRFHGNMSAMHSGIPALWIVHDSRTQEFCDLLGLPHAPMEKITKGMPMRDILAEYFDTTRFRRVYPENYARFYNYLQRQGVPHRLTPPN